MEAKNPSTEDLPRNSLRSTVDHKSLKILPRGVNLCPRNAPSMSELEGAELFDSQARFFFWTSDSH